MMYPSEKLTVDLWILDAVLTGHDPRNGRGNPDAIVDIEEFVFRGRLFYLSDGGYSRVGYSWEHGKLFLASESREEVKSRWESRDVDSIRRRVERYIDEWCVREDERSAGESP